MHFLINRKDNPKLIEISTRIDNEIKTLLARAEFIFALKKSLDEDVSENKKAFWIDVEKVLHELNLLDGKYDAEKDSIGFNKESGDFYITKNTKSCSHKNDFANFIRQIVEEESERDEE